MERTLMRLLEAGLDELRGTPGALRAAIIGEVPYELTGTVTGIVGPVLTDEEQHWAYDVYGSSTYSGQPRDACRVLMLTGAAAGQSAAILTTIESELRAAVDLEQLSVLPGDRYQILRPEDEKADAWLQEKAVRVSIDYPLEANLLPNLVVRPGPANKLPHGAIGRLHVETSSGEDGDEVARVERHPWHRQYQIEVVTVAEDEILWLSGAVEHILEQAADFLERLFEPGYDIQATTIMRTEDVQPTGAFNRTYTISGAKVRFLTRRPQWTNETPVRANPHPVPVQIE
jgi:hypothetical protein